MNRKIKYVLIVLLNLISITLFVGIHFLYKNFGNLTIEEIVFHLKVPLTGTDDTMIIEFLTVYVPIIIGITTLISFLLIYPIVRANQIRQKRADEAKAKKGNIDIENIEIKQVVIENNAENENNHEENIDGQLELDLSQYEDELQNEQNVEKENKKYGFKVVKNVSTVNNNIKNSKKRKVKKAFVKVKRANTNVTAKIFVALIMFTISVVYVANTTDVIKYISNQLNDSTFIQDEYVNPREADLQFPEKKRNLIYIYLESMESTYSSKEEGGGLGVNLIPELTELAKENTNFSNTDKIGGAVSLTGTTWTIAGMIAQTTGLPLKMGIEISNAGQVEEFLPGVYGIGEILEQEGYNNYLMIGSDAKFATRDKFFTAHGNYQIWDLNTAIRQGKMREQDKVWWGYNDKDLYQYAKEEITRLVDAGEPFNFTMLTADTHFPDGYLCQDCENKYFEKYYNVISCASKQAYDFVTWIQEQDFYENTTIIISGDHLTMQTGYFENLDTERTIYNVIINPAVETENSKNRIFSTMDMFPTTLAALGVKIEGDRLGIGTDLFSDTPTLMEEKGRNFVNEELQKASSFYNKEFLHY